MNEFERMEEQYRRGEISYEELVKRGDKAVEKAERNCAHRFTTVEESTNGGWIEWCDDCSGRVSSGGGGAKTVRAKSGSGCAVVALLLLGGVSAVVYGAAEAVRHLS